MKANCCRAAKRLMIGRKRSKHAHVTETHLRIGEGGREWGVETKPDVVKQPEEGRHKTKIY